LRTRLGALRTSRPGLLSAAVGLALGLLALGPGLRRGFLLSYDMLFVPREPFAAAWPGQAPPRAVPSDLVIATVSRVLPADLVQKAVLLAIFVLACSGAAVLLDRAPLLARLAAGVFYAWNPYVAERLIIGQWALLLGYAGLPWVLRAVLAPGPLSRRAVARLALALVPAVIGGFAALAVTALAVVPVTVVTRDFSRTAVVFTVLSLGSLPWLVPSLSHPVYVDPASVAAFAGRADTPFGSLGSLLMLGGNWNAQTVPKAYGGPWSALWLAAVLVALAAYLLLASRPRRWPGLGVAAVAGLLLAALGVTAPGRELLRTLINAWPGFAVLRDAQQFTAPLALAEALGFGLAVGAALHPGPFGQIIPRADPAGPAAEPGPAARTTEPGAERDRPARASGARASTVLAVLALLTPVLLLPGLAWGAGGRLRPAWYPAAWLAAARRLDASPAPGSVLLLPWATYRTPSWNHGEAVLDPWTRLLSRPLIWNDGTQVGAVALAPDDPAARSLAGAIAAGGPLTATLRAAGVRFVLDDATGSGPQAPQMTARLPGSVVIFSGPGLTVYQLP
jgi:hypothetical protein